MTDLPTVSIAMINRNYGAYVGEAVESALTQTRAALEVVVVDDGSTDDSRAVLEGFGKRITLVATASRGKGAATSTAVAACRGEVVALLDSDDLMLPERVERLALAYAEHHEARWVWHQLGHVDRVTRRPRPSPALKGYRGGAHDHRAAVARGRLPISTPATSALSWRRTFLQTLLPMPDATRSQDNYLKFLTLGLAPGCVLDEVLALQGLHAENSYTTATGQERRGKQAVRALDLAPALRAHGLSALHRRTVAEVLVSTAGGRRLPPPDRRALAEEVRRGGAGLLPWLGVATARRARQRLRSGPRE